MYRPLHQPFTQTEGSVVGAFVPHWWRGPRSSSSFNLPCLSCRWLTWSYWSWMSWTAWSMASCMWTGWASMGTLNATIFRTPRTPRAAWKRPAPWTTPSPCCWSTLALGSPFWPCTQRTTTNAWQAPGEPGQPADFLMRKGHQHS